MQLRRLAGAAAGLILLAAAGVGCSSTGNAVELAVGDCFQDPDSLSEVVDVETVDCDEDHDNEVFLLDEQPDGDYPGESDLQQTASEVCQGDEFEDYMGTSFFDTAINAGFLVPTEELWDEDFRNIVCFAFLPGEELDQSVEGAGEDFPLDGGSPPESGDAGDSGDAGGAGEDTSLEDFAGLVESCEGGDMADCDELYADTPIGSDAEAVALECGGEDPGGSNAGTCEDQFG